MNALNMIIMNMNAMNNMENAAQDAVNGNSSDKFSMLLKAQTNSGSEKAQANNIKDMLMFHMLAKDEDGKIVNLKAKITDTGVEEENEDSKCCDSNLQELVDGIVGILEGFGLLDYDMDENAMDKLSEDISQLVSIGEMDEKMNQALSQLIARMPNLDQNESVKDEIVPMIQEMVEKYQCSFENTNNTGVKKTELIEDVKESFDKIKFMLKNAVKNSEGKTNAKNDMNDNVHVFGTENKTDNVDNVENASAEADKVAEAMEDNVANIAEKITASQINGKKEFDVTLKPDFLGKLSVKLIMEEDGIRAQIKAADQYVKGIITDQLPGLSEQLRQKGVNMTNIEVVYENPDFSSFEGQLNQHSNMSGNSFKGSKSYYADNLEAIDTVAYEAALDYADLTMKNSSVEFTA